MKNSVVFLVEQALNEEEDENTADALDGFLAVLRGIPSLETVLPDGKSRSRHGLWQEQCRLVETLYRADYMTPNHRLIALTCLLTLNRKFAKSPLLLHLGSEADTAMSILTGDSETILGVTKSWEEAFSAILLYSDPECSRHDVV
jgi:hypothetical protein